MRKGAECTTRRHGTRRVGQRRLAPTTPGSGRGPGITTPALCRHGHVHPVVHAGRRAIDQGMSRGRQCHVLLGNAIVLVPMLLIGHAGAKYGTLRRARALVVRQWRFFVQGDRRLRLYGIRLGSADWRIHAVEHIDRQCAACRSAAVIASILGNSYAPRILTLQLYLSCTAPTRSLARDVFRADQDRHVPRARMVGYRQCRWLRHDDGHALAVRRRRQEGGTVLERVLAIADGDGRILGHACAEHP